MVISPASLAIIQNDSHSDVLLIKRRDLPIWVLPGGGIDSGETAAEAVIRELKEETGFDVSILRQAAHYTPINRLSSETFIFICSLEGGSIALSNESEEVAFFPIEDLPKNFFFIHERWLKENFLGTRVIFRSLDEISYLALAKYFLLNPWTVIRFAWTRLKNA